MRDSFFELGLRINEHLAEADALHEGVAHEAPALIEALQDVGGFGARSLRDVARRAELSPTYLSNVASRKSTCSFGAFIRLLDLLPMDNIKGENNDRQ